MSYLEEFEGQSLVYFLQCEDAVKIGYTASIRKRMCGIQLCNPKSLVIINLIAGTKTLEANFHKAFEHLWIGGEWFAYRDELLEFIKHENFPPIELRRGQSPLQGSQSWKGTEATLRCKKVRIRSRMPQGMCLDCNSLGTDIFPLKTWDSLDLGDYIRLCRKCHLIRSGAGERILNGIKAHHILKYGGVDRIWTCASCGFCSLNRERAAVANNMCMACYRHFRRYGELRPKHMIDKCKKTKVLLDGEYYSEVQ